jgi:ribose-phosphate pyrophosphokinase
MTIPGYGEIKLFAGSGCPDLAQRVADYLGITLGDWEILRFPNENIWIQLKESVRGQDVFIIQTHATPVHENLMESLIAIDCLHRDSAGRITLVCPFLAYSQSDQKTLPRVPITARLVADMIEVAGTNRWVTIDLHAGQIQGFYSIPGDHLTARHLLGDYLRQKDLGNAVVVTPDLGFAKGGRKFADMLGLPLAFVEKRRIGDDVMMREALSLIGDVAGKDCIIIDDLVDTAGSISQAVRVVKENGGRRIYLAFTHAVLSDPAVDRLRELPVEEIITTDTLPLPERKRLPNVTVLSVAGLLGEVIQRSHEGRSVGELFNE